MLSTFLFLPIVMCDRLLRLKHKDGLYVTNNDGTLKLECPMLPSMSDQRVVVHNRALYFFKDGIYYTLAMTHGGLEIKLIVYNAISEKGIGFLSSPTFRPRRRKIDPFGYLSHAGHKENPGDARKEKDNLPANKMKSGLQRSMSGSERPIAQKRNERIPKIQPREHGEYSEDRAGWRDRGSRQVKREKSQEAGIIEERPKPSREGLDEAEEPDNDSTGPKHDIPAEPRLNVEMSSVLRRVGFPKKTGLARQSYVVESDSKMDEHEFGYIIKNVLISEIDNKGHFTLVGGNNACVTYYKGSFVFMPCSRAPEQIFKLESSEEVAKRGKPFGPEDPKVGESQDVAALDSTESEDGKKEEDLYKNPQSRFYSSKSTSRDTSNFIATSTKADSRGTYRSRYLNDRPEKEELHVGYSKRDGRDELSRSALNLENVHEPLKIDVKTTKTTVGINPVGNHHVQEENNRKDLDYKPKEANRRQKLSLDDDFMDKFRELLTNSDLNNFV
ncbi:hypothetical protein [Encephalitozoon cuniculi GB-M1]|uniref:Uncharacterized protein n=1 Tax=Encephalitozoon cuniculi (strain GB-M1) TaxID=284813 RepID=Q8SV68_ENCCU|nr:uncharacterized protein ECU06_1540 [Encephalitozoon cuniculi GB-M1]KMV66051.1 hypothetical protein M970_061530 [Encephalitozoon cuniculi EcunIII-L]UYI27751.1 hypothetical protein J0A71_07g16330 [Encephalitozoon cuniculi]CAD25515.3 hypothetical protein [Encephalitozoon cuniculi GB-M1]